MTNSQEYWMANIYKRNMRRREMIKTKLKHLVFAPNNTPIVQFMIDGSCGLTWCKMFTAFKLHKNKHSMFSYCFWLQITDFYIVQVIILPVNNSIKYEVIWWKKNTELQHTLLIVCILIKSFHFFLELFNFQYIKKASIGFWLSKQKIFHI